MLHLQSQTHTQVLGYLDDEGVAGAVAVVRGGHGGGGRQPVRPSAEHDADTANGSRGLRRLTLVDVAAATGPLQPWRSMSGKYGGRMGKRLLALPGRERDTLRQAVCARARVLNGLQSRARAIQVS